MSDENASIHLVAYDPRFYEKLPQLFPHNQDARSWFTSNEGLAATTAFRIRLARRGQHRSK